jgi:hypothetical protein
MANTFRMTNELNLATSLEVIYTVPSATTTVVIGIMLSNTLATDSLKGSVQIVSTTATSVNSGAENANESVHLVKNVPVDSASSLELMGGNKVVLQTGDILKAMEERGLQ